MNIAEQMPPCSVGASFRYVPKHGIAGSSVNVSNYLRNLYIDFQSGCTIRQSHKQQRSVPLSPHPCQHLLSPEFFILAKRELLLVFLLVLPADLVEAEDWLSLLVHVTTVANLTLLI